MSRPKAYIDTSVLVKRFCAEARSGEVDAFFHKNTHQSVISPLSLTELQSVFRRRLRTNEISRDLVDQATRQMQLELNRGAWVMQPITDPQYAYASELIGQLASALGTLDALHLACAQVANCSLMVSADKQLLRASLELGLQALDLS